MARRDLDAVGLEIGEKFRAYSGWPEGAVDLSAAVGEFLHELKYLVHLNGVSFHSDDLADARQAARAVGKSLHLDDKRHCGGDLASDRAQRHRRARHPDHLLKPLQGVARGIGVNSGHGAFVASIHRLEHVERFFAATFADDNSIGPHSQRVANKIARSNFASALDIGRAGLQPADMRLLELEFRRILNGDQTFAAGNIIRQRVQHRRLSAARAARDDRRNLASDSRGENVNHRLRQGSDFDEPLHCESALGELANRNREDRRWRSAGPQH